MNLNFINLFIIPFFFKNYKDIELETIINKKLTFCKIR